MLSAVHCYISFFIGLLSGTLWALHLLGPAPTGKETIAFDPTFGSFTLLSEPVHLLKMFRLFKLEQMFFLFQDTIGSCTTSYLLAGPVCL